MMPVWQKNFNEKKGLVTPLFFLYTLLNSDGWCLQNLERLVAVI